MGESTRRGAARTGEVPLSDQDPSVDGFDLSVGEKLRQAREAKGLSLEDVATRTRVPLRHLESIERGAWSDLPAPTYSMGFAKSYADAVGLDRLKIADDVRAEVGGYRGAQPVETFEAADPSRVPPRALIFTALGLGALLIGGYSYWRSEQLGEAEPQIIAAEESPAAASGEEGMTPLTPPAGPVVITANEPAWIRVYERAGRKTLTETTLAAGQSYEVPLTAVDPLLRTSRPQALRISVGTADAPALGGVDELISDRSLKPAALLAAPASRPVPAPTPGSTTTPASTTPGAP